MSPNATTPQGEEPGRPERLDQGQHAEEAESAERFLPEEEAVSAFWFRHVMLLPSLQVPRHCKFSNHGSCTQSWSALVPL
jgi:hypothetical protein